MKFFLLFILPFASSQKDPSKNCPPPGEDPQYDPETQILCPGPIDFDGCQLPSYFLDKLDSDGLKDNDGNICLTSCPANCDWTKEIYCSNPPVNGCFGGSYCMPRSKDENGCPSTCPVYCDEDAGQVVCPGGINHADGCPLQDWCSYSYFNSETGVNCPGNCYSPPCNYDAGEQWCDKGTDMNGCWLGDYCATECAKNS